jgi:Nop14-like family
MAGQHGHKKAGPKKSHKSGSENKYVKMPKLKKAPENPFDKFANSKKKHEVINRRVKGEDRNVGKARKNAIESRKNRLQQDYQSTKKTNSFADR